MNPIKPGLQEDGSFIAFTDTHEMIRWGYAPKDPEIVKPLDCPFCGCVPVLHTESILGFNRVWRVACHHERCGCNPKTTEKQTPWEAVEVWNRRFYR